MPNHQKTKDFALAIHGGAGLNPLRLSDDKRRAILDSLTRIGRYGQRLLAEGNAALETVQQVVQLLEDDPLFNAGKGAVFNSETHHELDASIMDGKSKQCGAVAGVRTVKNPIHLARLVMEETPHVLLAGDGAEAFALEMNKLKHLEIVENKYFSIPERYEELQRAIERAGKSENTTRENTTPDDKTKGTVGCVAMDQAGNLAAATSTGGMTNKKFGRVGDSPIIGAGTYADNASAAVSCTGTGEYFIRHSVAFHVCALIMYKQMPVDDAVKILISEILPEDIGGIIAVDRTGQISMRTNTAGMPRASANSQGLFEVLIER